MAQITAQQVKELREMTGAGMMECKKALTEAEGDVDKAIDVLRTRGLAAAEKKAGRATNEGVVAIYTAGKQAGIVEVNCETDFVSATPEFRGFCDKLAQTVVARRVSSLDALMDAQVVDGDTVVKDLLTEQIHTIGENMKVARMALVELPEGQAGALESYIHMGGKIGVCVEFAFQNEATASSDEFVQFAHDVALQVAAAKPLAVSRENVSADVIEHELSIYRAQAAESGKPEAIQNKIAEGKLNKFFKECTLVEQEFIKDSDQTIESLCAKTSKACGDEIQIKNFYRFAMGESPSEA